MTGADIDAIVTGILSDPNYRTWTQPNRLLWINLGVLDICSVKPKASTVTENIPINAGTTRQPMPTDYFNVLDLFANMGSDGATPGNQITLVTADRMAASNRPWRRDTGAAVRHFVQDDRDKSAFYVWPAIKTGPWYVEGLVHKRPTPVPDMATVLPLADEYKGILVEYVLHMAYAQDGENADHASLSTAHYSKYGSMLGLQSQRQKKATGPANSAEAPQYPAVDKNGQ